MTPAQVLELARHAADILIALVPREQAMGLLDEAEVRRANQAADLAELLKFGPEESP